MIIKLVNMSFEKKLNTNTKVEKHWIDTFLANIGPC